MPRMPRTPLARLAGTGTGMSESRRVEFPGSQGAPVAAFLELPDCEPRAHALFVHGFTGGVDSVAASRLCHALSVHGIAVLCFDATGLASAVDELVLAADYLRASHGAPTLLIGHDLGGAAVLAATHRIPETRAVATIGAPATTAVQQDAIHHLGAALLVMHSPVDEAVGVDNAREIFDAARHPKSFLALDGADHQLSDQRDTEFAASMLSAWAARYLPAPPPVPEPLLEPVLEAATEPGVVTVTEKDAAGLAQLVTAGRHTFTADEPVPIGADTGANPYDLLLAALGACTSMTLRMYASHKNWPLEKVSISLRHSRIHARDCEECETTGGMVSQMDRVIRLDGPLDAAQRARLLEIADKCPVHRTLTSEISIRTVAAS
jgi:putative redox protein